MDSNESSKTRVASSLFWTYAILVLHVVLMLLVGIAIVFFRGVYDYFGWILAGGLALLLLSAFLVLRRLRRDQRRIRDFFDDPVFRGRSVEISFLGGVASFRLGRQGEENLSIHRESRPLIESPEAQRAEALARLGGMLEQEQISRGEFDQLKRELLARPCRTDR